MVRFSYERPQSKDGKSLPLFPHYTELWTSYDPRNTSNCDLAVSWEQLWEIDEVRDDLHRRNSYHYAKITEKHKYEEPSLDDYYQPLSILLFAAIVFVIFVPQVIDLFMTAYCKGPPPPPAPPTPPPRPPSRKRLKLFHHVLPRPPPTSTSSSKRKLSQQSASQSIYTTASTANEENILSYVSATRIRALKRYRHEKRQILALASQSANV